MFGDVAEIEQGRLRAEQSLIDLVREQVEREKQFLQTKYGAAPPPPTAAAAGSRHGSALLISGAARQPTILERAQLARAATVGRGGAPGILQSTINYAVEHRAHAPTSSSSLALRCNLCGELHAGSPATPHLAFEAPEGRNRNSAAAPVCHCCGYQRERAARDEFLAREIDAMSGAIPLAQQPTAPALARYINETLAAVDIVKEQRRLARLSMGEPPMDGRGRHAAFHTPADSSIPRAPPATTHVRPTPASATTSDVLLVSDVVERVAEQLAPVDANAAATAAPSTARAATPTTPAAEAPLPPAVLASPVGSPAAAALEGRIEACCARIEIALHDVQQTQRELHQHQHQQRAEPSLVPPQRMQPPIVNSNSAAPDAGRDRSVAELVAAAVKSTVDQHSASMAERLSAVAAAVQSTTAAIDELRALPPPPPPSGSSAINEEQLEQIVRRVMQQEQRHRPEAITLPQAAPLLLASHSHREERAAQTVASTHEDNSSVEAVSAAVSVKSDDGRDKSIVSPLAPSLAPRRPDPHVALPLPESALAAAEGVKQRDDGDTARRLILQLDEKDTIISEQRKMLLWLQDQQARLQAGAAALPPGNLSRDKHAASVHDVSVEEPRTFYPVPSMHPSRSPTPDLVTQPPRPPVVVPANNIGQGRAAPRRALTKAVLRDLQRQQAKAAGPAAPPRRRSPSQASRVTAANSVRSYAQQYESVQAQHNQSASEAPRDVSRPTSSSFAHATARFQVAYANEHATSWSVHHRRHCADGICDELDLH